MVERKLCITVINVSVHFLFCTFFHSSGASRPTLSSHILFDPSIDLKPTQNAIQSQTTPIKNIENRGERLGT